MEIYFVLTRPVVPENIGASARALATMGFEHLRLVSPCDHLQDRARWMACGAASILEQAEVFSDLGQAVADLDLVIASTARMRKQRHQYDQPSELRQVLARREETVEKVGIVFGPESSGLFNDDLCSCDLISSVPSAENCPALNLAQTVMIYAYELSSLVDCSERRKEVEAEPNTSQLVLREKLGDLFSLLDIEQSNPAYARINERLAAFEREDIRLIHFLRKKILDKLPKA